MNQLEFSHLMDVARTKLIQDYLKRIGITPVRENNNNLWYLSPLRSQERTPSFKVNTQINKWMDFGNGMKGDVIDLVMVLERKGTLEAIKSLNTLASSTSFSFGGHPSNPEKNESAIEVIKIQPVENKALIQYMESRAIPFNLGAKYLKEVYYSSNGKRFFSLAFPNDCGGYALRNKYFKSALSPAGITTIEGNTSRLHLFEGFFDFLSALVYFKCNCFQGTTIVLNSVNYIDPVLPALHSYDEINLFLDNDHSGRKASKRVRETHQAVNDHAESIYPNDKDFNQHIVKL